MFHTIMARAAGAHLGFILSLTTMASGYAAGVVSFPALAEIRFDATSTLHDFGGSLPAQPFLLVLSNGTWSADADVLARLMATGHEKRDRNMYRMLNTNAHPRLHGRVVAAPIPAPGRMTNVTLNLKIAGRAHDLPARVSEWHQSSNEVRFRTEWEVSLNDFALKPPSVLGVIRVGDRVRIQAYVTASRTNHPPALPPPKP
jgi:hypothetical protein